MAVMLGLGFAGGRVTADKPENKSNPENIFQSKDSSNSKKTEQEINNNTKLTSKQNTNNSLQEFNKSKRNKAKEQFDNKTKKALNKIITDSTNQEISTDKVITNLVGILDKELKKPKYVNNSLIIEDGDKDSWIKAIYSYQINKQETSDSADGIIDDGDNTAQNLKEDLTSKLK